MATTAEKVRELRDKTGAGVMDCKEALAASGEDLEKAIDFLRKKGLAAASKRAHREARDGVVASYIHAGSKLGVLIEVNCETDFVARTEQFQELFKGLAMQIAAASPVYVSRQAVPVDVLEKEKAIYRAQLEGSGKPSNVVEKIIVGRNDIEIGLAYFPISPEIMARRPQGSTGSSRRRAGSGSGSATGRAGGRA